MQIHVETKHATEFDEIDESPFVKFKTYKAKLKSEKKITLIRANIVSEQTYGVIHSTEKPDSQATNTIPESALGTSKPPRPKLNNKKCSFCKDEIIIGEKSIIVKSDAYHSVCFEFVVDKVKPQKQRNHSKDKKSKAQGQIDPVLILLMGGIFGLLLLTAYLMLSFVSAIAISIGMALSFYHIIDAGSSFSNKPKPKQIPSYFIFVTLIMPIIFGVVIAFDGYEIWYSIPKAIIVWGLTLTFWSNLVFVPLSAPPLRALTRNIRPQELADGRLSGE